MNERIRIVRKHFDLTQAEFASRIHSKPNTVTQWEIGRNQPNDQCIHFICEEFSVNEEWLRTGEGPMFSERDRDDQLMEWAGRVLGGEPDSFKRKFVKMLMGLSEREWEFLERKAKELAGEDDE